MNNFFKWIEGKIFDYERIKEDSNILKEIKNMYKNNSNDKVPVPVLEECGGKFCIHFKSTEDFYIYKPGDLQTFEIDELELAKSGLNFVPFEVFGIGYDDKKIEKHIYPAEGKIEELLSEILSEVWRKRRNLEALEVKVYQYEDYIRLTLGGKVLKSRKNKDRIEKDGVIYYLYKNKNDLKKLLANDSINIKSLEEDELISWALKNEVFTYRVLFSALKNKKFKELKNQRAIKYIRSKVKKLSSSKSQNLTLEWLVWMMGWEMVHIYREQRVFKIWSGEFYYLDKEHLVFPISFKPHIDEWDLEGLSIRTGKSEYRHRSIKNLGYDNKLEGLKLEIAKDEWKESIVEDIEVRIDGKTYGLKFKPKLGLCVDTDEDLSGKEGKIDGVEVLIEKGNSIRVKDADKPVKLPYPSYIERKNPNFIYEILNDEMWEIVEKYDKNKKISDLLLKEWSNLNIEFIWGPPATGKTEEISERIKNDLDSGAERILVLTPTNKAADVIAERLVNRKKIKNAYRFKVTMSESLRNKNKVIENEPEEPYVLITTIHRYLYDKFRSNKPLKNSDWDKIYIDEASMIPIPFILSVLYKSQNKEVVIGGDAFQLAPVGVTPGYDTQVKGFSTENIYTILGLNNFNTSYVGRFKVHTLTTQYRSIKPIGELYSQYMYGGALQHYRYYSTRQLSLNLRGVSLDVYPITLMRFPVRYIYMYKTSDGSSYHLSSAVFAVELADALNKRLEGEKSIGIIAHYSAQVLLMKGLKDEMGLDNVNVNTVHAFQGDERDVIIVVLNPPSLKPKPASHFNNKNLINVAISRARDYLIILVPCEGDKKEGCIEKNMPVNVKDLIDKIDKLKNNSPEAIIERNISDIIREIENDIDIFQHRPINVYGSSIDKLSNKRYVFFIENRGVADVLIKAESEHLE